ncbi:MAG: leucyl aminopeptidase [Neisseriaceae bacterium]|nr:MAG: leucyl aminopeptidase [Neisseriaceae bacterium]
MLDNYQKSFDSENVFKPCFEWIKGQDNSFVFIHFLGLSQKIIQNSIDFIIRTYSDFSYEFKSLKQKSEDPNTEKEIFFVVENEDIYRKTLSDAIIVNNNIALAKDLGNLPSNICTPSYLANFAKKKAQDLNVTCRIHNKESIKQLGMHSFLSVAKGSIEEPYFIELEYHGKDENGTNPIVLVGKGITFDSGGISLKPSKNMDEMKYDMCGAASVLLTFFAAIELKLPVNLVALVPTCENLPSDRAMKPGDIVQSLKGLSIEILNTDAEGRLILCDALTYAEKFKPQAVIDVATLTGACLVALGQNTNGIMGSDQTLIDNLLVAAQNTGDKTWQLPLWEEHQQELKSNFADLANIGASGYAGTITAAAFLSRFIDAKYSWAHIDIAGTAWKTAPQKGATGRPINLLINFLKHTI